MPDTFFTGPPHWTWLIILYFFVGGIAGGACFLATTLDLFGRPEDRPVIRTGYYTAFWGAIVSGVLLTLDLGRPLRFWHMLFQSNHLPSLMFKAWSPISFGAWALLLFGAFAALAALGARVEEGKVRLPTARILRSGTALARLIALIAGLLGFFVAGYTGILLSVTNRPIWADSPWLGALFVASAASTGAATLSMLGAGGGAAERSLRWLSTFDSRALVVELVILIVFLWSLGTVARVWVSGWGLVLLVGVVGAGILWPLRLHARRNTREATVSPAALVLLGGFLLRVVTIYASEGIAYHHVAQGVTR